MTTEQKPGYLYAVVVSENGLVPRHRHDGAAGPVVTVEEVKSPEEVTAMFEAPTAGKLIFAGLSHIGAQDIPARMKRLGMSRSRKGTR